MNGMSGKGAPNTAQKPPLVTPLPADVAAFPPDVARLLDVFARIELRRQARLRSLRTPVMQEAS